jgi:hypothetical protein
MKYRTVISDEAGFSMMGLCNVSSEGVSRTRKLLPFLDKLNLPETRVTTGLQSTQLEINRRLADVITASVLQLKSHFFCTLTSSHSAASPGRLANG